MQHAVFSETKSAAGSIHDAILDRPQAKEMIKDIIDKNSPGKLLLSDRSSRHWKVRSCLAVSVENFGVIYISSNTGPKTLRNSFVGYLRMLSDGVQLVLVSLMPFSIA
jgi:hypothetical protein